jgi:AraC-like DNA-binding protein
MTTPQPESRPHANGAEKDASDGSHSPEPQPQDQPNVAAPADWRVQKIIALFGQDLSRHWTLGELSALARVTPGYLEQLFKEATGSCPLQYLKALRLERVLAELTDSEKKVWQIAKAVGYQPRGRHFFRDFKARYGMSPRQCRRQFQEWAEQLNEAE